MLTYQTLNEAKHNFNFRYSRNPNFRIVRLNMPVIEEVLEFDFAEALEGRRANDAYDIYL